jgi:hypothetical protein
MERMASRFEGGGGGSDPMLGLGNASGGSSNSSIGVQGSASRDRMLQIRQDHQGALGAEVAQNMARRVGGRVPKNERPDPLKYLERFGGYAQNRELGLLAWLVCNLLSNLWAKEWGAVDDDACLLLLAIEQANLDGGHWDLAWIFALQEDPPTSVFSRVATPTTINRNFSLLASQSWITVSMAYLRELETLQTRRSELTRGGGRGGGGRRNNNPNLQNQDQDQDAEQKAKAKSKARPKIKGQKPEPPG